MRNFHTGAISREKTTQHSSFFCFNRRKERTPFEQIKHTDKTSKVKMLSLRSALRNTTSLKALGMCDFHECEVMSLGAEWLKMDEKA